jgi:hypothetical protein
MSNKKGNYPFNLIRDIFGDKADDNTHTQAVYLKGLYDHIQRLDSYQQEYIALRYEKKFTRKECAEHMDLNIEQARQLEAKTLRHLRNPRSAIHYYAAPLRDFNIITEKYDRLRSEHDLLNTEYEKLKAVLHDVASGKIKPSDITTTFDAIQTSNMIHSDPTAIKIQELDLSTRSYNSLKRKGINTLGDLTQLSEEELLSINGIGRYCLDEIKTLFQNYDLEFNRRD